MIRDSYVLFVGLFLLEGKMHMIMTEAEVFEFIEEEDVKFIRLAFVDVYGNQKNVSIMPMQLKKAIDVGIPIDSSMITGFDSYSDDLFLVPDLNTLSLLPWRPQRGRVIRFFCNIYYPDRKPFLLDSRKILKDAIDYASKKGVRFEFGCKSEFYLFKKDEFGNETKNPIDNASYLDIAPVDHGENVRREICLTLEEMHIIPICSHHEEGPGQNVIEFCQSDPLSAADNITTVKGVVKTIANEMGLWASFNPKPLLDYPGNGFHIHIMANQDSRYIMNGILSHIKEMTLFLNRVDESYQRLGQGRAPKYINWSHSNVGSLVRLPNDLSRVELRSPDSLANPYLAYALLIYAGIDGILNEQSPAVRRIDDLELLPTTLREAFNFASNSPFILKYLPKNLIKAYE